jgi:hypothetical protein
MCLSSHLHVHFLKNIEVHPGDHPHRTKAECEYKSRAGSRGQGALVMCRFVLRCSSSSVGVHCCLMLFTAVARYLAPTHDRVLGCGVRCLADVKCRASLHPIVVTVACHCIALPTVTPACHESFHSSLLCKHWRFKQRCEMHSSPRSSMDASGGPAREHSFPPVGIE